MKKVDLKNTLLCVNLNKEHLDFTQIKNRRFMYHADGWLILGVEDVLSRKGAKLLKSHAEEYHEATGICDSLPSFDSFIRGWIGVGDSYKDGIIHFAPHIPSCNIEMFENAFSFIEATLQNGFTKNAILRGFPGAWEQSIQTILPDCKELLTQKISNAHKKQVNSSQKRIIQKNKELSL